MGAITARRGQMLAIAVASTLAAMAGKSSGQTTSFLSVDLNGGVNGTDLQPNLGGQAHDPVGGFVWTPWGGQTNTGGDGTQLPNNNGNIGGYPNLILSRSFTSAAVTSGALSVALNGTISGTNQNISFTSRDRGSPSTGSTNFGDLYRDLVFLQRNASNGLGANRFAVQLSGLDANKTYTFTSFNFDNSGGAFGQVVYSNTDPQSFGYAQITASGFFQDPPEPLHSTEIGPRVTFVAGSAPTTNYGASSTFKFTTDNSGNATFYEWCNSFSGQAQTPINGFQIDNVAYSTNWSGTSANNTWGGGPWSNGSPNAIEAVANFGPTASSQNVALEAPKTVGVLNLNSASSYNFTGSTLTMDAMSSTFKADSTASSPTTTFNGYAQINLLGASNVNVTHTIASAVVLNDNTGITVAPDASNLAITGPISGGGAINKFGNGLVTLSGTNSYSGTTAIFGGRLHVNGVHSGAGTYTVTNGGVLGGNGTVHGQVDVWNSGNLAPGTTGVGTLTMDRLALGSHNSTSGSVGFTLDIGGGSADKIVVTDSDGFKFASLAFEYSGNGNASPWIGTVNITPVNAGGIGAGTFTILDYAGTALADLSQFALTTTSLAGFTLSLVNNTANTSIDLQVIQPGITWNVDNVSPANWSLGSNWTGGIAPNAVDAIANFGTIITAPRTVNVDSPQTVGVMNFSSPNSYSIGGATASTITMDVTTGQAAINVSAGTHTISSPVTLNDDLTITSSLNTGVAMTGNLTATGKTITKAGLGTVQFENVRAAALNVTLGKATISAKGTNNNNAGTSVVTSLGVTAGATLDLTNNSAIVDYSVSSPLTTIRDLIKTGYNNGNWNGTGITSASAAAVALTSNAKTAIGYGEASTLGLNTFGGQNLPDTTAVLLKYTLRGDSNLDLKVNALDFNALAANFGSGTDKVWTQGDYDYNGVVNTQDFSFLSLNFNQTLPVSAQALGTLVPEPFSAGLFCGLGVLLRRRKRA